MARKFFTNLSIICLPSQKLKVNCLKQINLRKSLRLKFKIQLLKKLSKAFKASYRHHINRILPLKLKRAPSRTKFFVTISILSWQQFSKQYFAKPQNDPPGILYLWHAHVSRYAQSKIFHPKQEYHGYLELCSPLICFLSVEACKVVVAKEGSGVFVSGVEFLLCLQTEGGCKAISESLVKVSLKTSLSVSGEEAGEEWRNSRGTFGNLSMDGGGTRTLRRVLPSLFMLWSWLSAWTVEFNSFGSTTPSVYDCLSRCANSQLCRRLQCFAPWLLLPVSSPE